MIPQEVRRVGLVGAAVTLLALMSLGLFALEALGPAVLALDLVIALVALADLATLIGAGAFRVERRCGAVGRMAEKDRADRVADHECEEGSTGCRR